MKIKFSKDYQGPGFGFLTKAREYDKWAHLAGSAAGGLFLILIGIPTGWALAVIALLGLGLEIYQGKRRWEYDNADKAFPSDYDQGDGFSFLDLVADALGLLLVWGVMR